MLLVIVIRDRTHAYRSRRDDRLPRLLLLLGLLLALAAVVSVSTGD